MCGRFANSEDPETLASYFLAVLTSRGRIAWSKTWNAAPTQSLPIITQEGSRRWLDQARWGWAGPTGSLLVNARGEEAAGKRTWREALASRRCVVPATAFYEWRERDKQPYAFALDPPAPMAIGGLWSESDRGVAFVLLTTPANPVVAPVHHRMAMLLDRPDVDAWLANDTAPERVQALITPFPAERMRAWTVSQQVNSVRNNRSGLLDPVAVAEQQRLFSPD
jgi:putative SOS response-associated peptidase YedK